MSIPRDPNVERFISQFKQIFQSGSGKGPDKKKPAFLPFFIIFLGIALISFNIFFVYIKPNEYGVKIKLLGPGAGIQDETYSTGLYLVIPGVQVMEKFPKTLQVVHFTKFPKQQRRGRNVKVERAAHIQTYDGYFVDVDLTIFFHITNPVTVIKALGKRGVYESAIIPKAVPALKETLGKLTTEQFYNSKMRVEQMNAAKALLAAEFEQKGLTVDEVLIRYFVYSNEIQKNIEEKKLKDQLVFKNQAEAKAAKEGAKLKKVTEEGVANVEVILEEGRAYVTKKQAETDSYVRKKKAEANLLIKLAEADKARRKNEALKSGGSDKLVGIEMAKILKGVDTIILPSDGGQGINPLNLQKTLKTFEVK